MKGIMGSIAVLLAAASVWAAPGLVNYQGILTDTGGAVISGPHDLEFTIYPDSALGAPMLWTELHTGVDVDDGLFHVILGSTNPLPDTLFAGPARWLGIIVDGSEKILPKTRITSVPWALRAAVADSAAHAPAGGTDGDWTINGNDMYSNVSGDVGIGTTLPVTDLHVMGSDTLGALMVAPNDAVNENSSLFLAEDSDGTYGMEWRFNGATNHLELWGKSITNLYGPHVTFARDNGASVFAGSGNSAITLPDNGVSALETLDEPGVACSTWTGTNQLLYLSVHTLVSRSITCPASGYVVAIATAHVQWFASGTFAADGDFCVSDQNATIDEPYFSLTYPGYMPNGSYNVPVTVQRVFPVTAGTHTFYFLGGMSTNEYTLYDKQLTLIYLPTAYGAVSSFASNGMPGPESEAERAEAERLNEERLEREVAELRAQVEEIRARIEPDRP